MADRDHPVTAADGLSCPSTDPEALDPNTLAPSPSPDISSNPSDPSGPPALLETSKALAAAFHHAPRPPLAYRANSLSEATMASGMAAMKRAMAVGLRD